jgi:regulation of enolase protein 1 (concanavalin A-like superfamily)
LTDLNIIDFDEGEDLLLKAIAASEEMGYNDKLASLYVFLNYLYTLIEHLDEDHEKRRFAREKADCYLPYLKPELSAYSVACYVFSNSIEADKRLHIILEAFDAGVKSGNAWSTILAASDLASIYRGQGKIQKAIEVYEHGYRAGIRSRFIFYNYLMRIIDNLIELHLSVDNKARILEMMLQIIDSTFVLHGKPKVHPTVQQRWNSIVEQVYQTLNRVAPEVYHELERSLETRLEQANTDDEQFFYDGQLALLAMLDNRREDAEACVQEMLKLRPNAGSFAQRLHQMVEYIIELTVTPQEQRQEVIKKWLRSVDNFNRFQIVLDRIRWLLSEDEVFSAIDWNYLGQLALDYLKIRMLGAEYTLQLWVPVEQFYKRYRQLDILQGLARQVQRTMADILAEEGTTHLLLEPVEMSIGSPESIEQFNQDPVAAGWEWVDPRGDCNYELYEEGHLQITVPPGHDLWSSSNRDAPRLLQLISGDFAIEAKLSGDPVGRKFGGLVIWRDEANFARFDVASSNVWYEGCIYYGVRVAGKFIHPGIHPFESEEAWLRMERKGDRFTGYVSADSENWYRCGWADIPMEDPIQVGIHALCPQAPATSTRFEDFRLYRPER